MKRIIAGKRYDTETSTEIAEWSNGHFRSDFHYCAEALYKTRRGAWFIAGEGGPLSKYSERVGSMCSGGEGLTPLTPDEARQWLERHDFVDELEECFGEQIEEA